MRHFIAVVLVLVAGHAVSAEVIVGTATLEYQATPHDQPGSCATRTLEETQDEVCNNMWPWLRHDVVDFRDLKGQVRNIGSVVVTAHQPLAGKWLLVVEELPEEEANKFGAQYKIIVRSPILPSACLDQAIEGCSLQ
jgi:hypothetical protein